MTSTISIRAGLIPFVQLLWDTEEQRRFTDDALTRLKEKGKETSYKLLKAGLALRRPLHSFSAGSAVVTHSPAALVDVLLSHRERSEFTNSSDFVFCKRDGSPLDPNYLRKKVLYPAMKKAGIVPGARTHGFHMFRRSAGSIVHAKTGDLKLAQELLGHARISTTSDIYVHVPEKLAELATEVMAQELSCAHIVPKTKERIN